VPPALVRCLLLNGLRRPPRAAPLLPCGSARSRRIAAPPALRVTSLHTIVLHAVALHACAAAPPLPAAGPTHRAAAAHALLGSAAACSRKGGPGRRWPQAPRRSFTRARQLRTAGPALARLPPAPRSAPARLPPALHSCAARTPAHVASAASLRARYSTRARLRPSAARAAWSRAEPPCAALIQRLRRLSRAEPQPPAAWGRPHSAYAALPRRLTRTASLARYRAGPSSRGREAGRKNPPDRCAASGRRRKPNRGRTEREEGKIGFPKDLCANLENCRDLLVK
jgi:hypothetical protein